MRVTIEETRRYEYEVDNNNDPREAAILARERFLHDSGDARLVHSSDDTPVSERWYSANSDKAWQEETTFTDVDLDRKQKAPDHDDAMTPDISPWGYV